ncbi:unnamed protein product [Acidithrix sp. C25]|nr:unnamed protein product [Acidithrix sp. C25]
MRDGASDIESTEGKLLDLANWWDENDVGNSRCKFDQAGGSALIRRREENVARSQQSIN